MDIRFDFSPFLAFKFLFMLKLIHRSALPILAWGGLIALSWNLPIVWTPRVALAAEVNWDATEWTPLDDKAQSGIDWRFAPGSVLEGGALEWNYQFRNRYQKPVKFQSTLSYEDQSGAQKTEVKAWVIGPQESRGAVLVGKKLGTVEITKPEVAKPTDTAPDPQLPERQTSPAIDVAAEAAKAEAAKAEAERKRKQEAAQQAEVNRQAEIAAEVKRRDEVAARQAQEAEKQRQEAARQTQETQRLESEKAQAAEKVRQEAMARQTADLKAAEQQKALEERKAAADKAAEARALEAVENTRAVQKQQDETQKAQLAKQQRQAEARLQQAEARAQQAELRARQAEEREKQALEKAQLEAKAVPLVPAATAPEAPPLMARIDNPAETGAGSKVERGGASWRLAPQALLAGHGNAAGALAFSPDGAILASCSWRQVNGAQSSEIILRDVASGQTLRILEGRWQTAWSGKGAKPPWVGHWGKINSLAFSPDGAQLASGGEDGRVTIWDVKSGKALKTLEKSARPVLSLSFVALQSLSALSRDGKVMLWNLSDNRVQTLPLGTSNSGDWVRVGAFSRDGAQVAIGDANGALTIWSLPGGSLARRLNNSLHQDLEQPQGVEATALAFSPDGRLLLSANHAHIYLNSVQKSPDFPDYRAKVLFAGQRVRQLLWSPDAQSALAVGEGKVVLVNPRGKSAAEANLGELTAPGTAIREVAVSPLQTTFASGGAEGNVVLWK